MEHLLSCKEISWPGTSLNMISFFVSVFFFVPEILNAATKRKISSAPSRSLTSILSLHIHCWTNCKIFLSKISRIMYRSEWLKVNTVLNDSFKDVSSISSLKVNKQGLVWTSWRSNIPPGIYLLQVKNGNSRTTCEICSKLTIKTSKRRQWTNCFFPLLTLNK